MAAKRVLRSSAVVNIEDLRHLAQRRLPKSVFDYVDGGAEAEATLDENCRVFCDVIFRPRGAVAITDCNLETEVLGHELSFPAMLAPVGYSRLMHSGGRNGRSLSRWRGGHRVSSEPFACGVPFRDSAGSVVRRNAPRLEAFLARVMPV